ncbi:MAG: C40 family peptidase [Croceitalea sp.]|nr:C40 family peptidase [Croceitalea sp.]MBT8238652.1 C40 family peptidase [Croceitalea sp.]NNL09149.1 C40 family peptidase [Croceitalea sp.]NNM19224.1 C40 family peptidase [Croceitalea sp.]
MQYGICHLSIVPVRLNPANQEELVTQLLYGDLYQIKEQRKHWSRIKTAFDDQEGWIANNQIHPIDQTLYEKYNGKNDHEISTDFMAYVTSDKGVLSPIVLGSRVDLAPVLKDTFEGNTSLTLKDKPHLVQSALLYLNAPFMWGGKTPFGIDSAGFTQMVYKLNGYRLFRDTIKQSNQGEALSFIEESEPGDLAFFDNDEGIINHVGIILKDNYIIHAHGKVRIDRIDHTGIFNTDEKQYTHQLRVIKKIA